MTPETKTDTIVRLALLAGRRRRELDAALAACCDTCRPRVDAAITGLDAKEDA